jgi:6-pyruvoyl-tetrahydropterin synthase
VKIFVEHVCSLDSVILDAHHGPLGQTWRVDVVWSGDMDSTGMLIDFAVVKKIAKQLLEQRFDHKLFVSKDHVRKIFLGEDGSQDQILVLHTSDTPQGFFALHTHRKSVEVCEAAALAGLARQDTQGFASVLRDVLLSQKHNHVKDISLEISTPPNPCAGHEFFYLHSLCHHKGYCQRFHGHRGFISVFESGQYDEDKSKTLAQHLNKKYLVPISYLVSDWDNPVLKDILEHCPEITPLKNELHAFSYVSELGRTTLVLPKEKTVFLQAECTVENITLYMHSLFPQSTNLSLKMYEGCGKGAMFP